MAILNKVILIAVIILAALSADTRIYIGTENDQVIFGIASTVVDVDGIGGFEIRNYAAKKGLLVEGREYGSKPSKTIYTLTAGGKTMEGTFLKYQHSWSSLENDALLRNAIQLGYGQGNRILSH